MIFSRSSATSRVSKHKSLLDNCFAGVPSLRYPNSAAPTSIFKIGTEFQSYGSFTALSLGLEEFAFSGNRLHEASFTDTHALLSLRNQLGVWTESLHARELLSRPIIRNKGTFKAFLVVGISLTGISRFFDRRRESCTASETSTRTMLNTRPSECTNRDNQRDGI